MWLPLLLLLSSVAVATVGGTRLPLEVFEITPTSSAAEHKHKALEYTVYDAKDLAAAVAGFSGVPSGVSSSSSTVKPPAVAEPTLTVVNIPATEQESRRHARQMLQKQQQQHRSSSNSNKHGGGHGGDKDLRILYQVGVS